jgi:hypothetical protein
MAMPLPSTVHGPSSHLSRLLLAATVLVALLAVAASAYTFQQARSARRHVTPWVQWLRCASRRSKAGSPVASACCG